MKVSTVEFYDVRFPDDEAMQEELERKRDDPKMTQKKFSKLYDEWQKKSTKLEIDEIKKFAKAMEKEIPGLQMNFTRDTGDDNFGPEFELKHEDELTLRKALYMCNAIGGDTYRTTDDAIKFARELRDELMSRCSDQEILNDKDEIIWDE